LGVRVRVRLPDLVLGQRVEELVFALKAPLLGWREAAGGLPRLGKLARLALFMPRSPYGPMARRGRLLLMARSLEGGASPEAYFQQLLSEVRFNLSQDAEAVDQLLTVMLTGVIALGIVASLGFYGPLSLVVMVLIGVGAMLTIPRAYYPTIDDTDLMGLALAVGVGIAAARLADGYLALALSMLVYGSLKAPSLIHDVRLVAGLPTRVVASFNEVLTRPNPTPIRDLSPIEAGLMRLWGEARRIGAPAFVGFANELVLEYINTVRGALNLALAYGALTIGVGGALGAGLMGYIAGLIHQSLTTQAPLAVPFISNLPQGAFYSAVGSGVAGGMVMMDWRLGSLIGGALGLAAWLTLHALLTA